MGQTLSAPNKEKFTTEGENEWLYFGASEMQGWRVSMEDAHTTILDLPSVVPAAAGVRSAFFAVFDGHGGKTAAKYCGKNVHIHVARDPAFAARDFMRALKAGFLRTDIDIQSDADFKAEVSGCTANVALLVDDTIFLANAGDSRSILSSSGEVFQLSFDHKPSNDGESKRIVEAGGFVEYQRVNGNLALSRAIGDFEYKQNLQLPPEKQIVTADPDIIEKKLHPDDEFIVMACDGIWDTKTNQEVINFVRRRLNKGMKLGQICEELMEDSLAVSAGSIGCDNMTVIIVALLQGKRKEEWYAKFEHIELPPEKVRTSRMNLSLNMAGGNGVEAPSSSSSAIPIPPPTAVASTPSREPASMPASIPSIQPASSLSTPSEIPTSSAVTTNVMQ